jgi:hypothetical protein
MTLTEPHSLVDYCFKELDLAAEAKNGVELRRVKGLIFTLAGKDLEIARFGLTGEQRAASLRTATSLYELAKNTFLQSARRRYGGGSELQRPA